MSGMSGMSGITDNGVGQRVRGTRKLRGWTQERLAQEVARYSDSVSLSLIRQVEQGRLPASPSFTAACARALEVAPGDLYEETYPRTTPDEQKMHAGIPEIRRELAAYHLPPGDVPIRPFADLARDVARASQLRHLVKLGDLGRLLPPLLHDLRAARHSTTGPDEERIFGLLAETFAATSQAVYKLGYTDLSSLAVDRYEWAAARSGDELAVLVGDYQRAGELICVADFAAAERLLATSRSRLEDELHRGDQAILATYGNLHLKSALAAARWGKRDAADVHLEEARQIAARIGTDRDDYRLCFGPANVAIWSVGLAVESMDGTEAVKRSENLRLPPETPRERVGHHYIDLARGHLLNGDRQRAFAALQTAKKITPTQTRYHPMVRETVRTLARQEARATDTVRGFAAWCGITHLD
ncbi:helix-turn-helix domain-containing protein [Nocardia asteroides]|uniref:helix-turn-helix domain-containing protein n=1 Tax=Nocardia asteroides TaxID=1824 RepID=UPI001E57F792|nr:helix-turn-helix transcriptional regulator [Nocardia asteroides]UGT60805.1 helix-turn-helix domain-containing protein [Nocardia asteroides]